MTTKVSRHEFAFHEESSGYVDAAPERVFAMLDDHARLAAHTIEPSWRMGWATMHIITDPKGPRGAGARIMLRGRIFGIHLWVEEAVTGYDRPRRKEWETITEPRLLVIGSYKMGFETTPAGEGTTLRVTIDYNRPTSPIASLLALLFGRMYARWCTSQMVRDAAISAAPSGRTAAATSRSFQSA